MVFPTLMDKEINAKQPNTPPQAKSHAADTVQDHLCQLTIGPPIPRTRLTSIVCTIGPATSSPEMLEGLILSGMNIARLNLTYGTQIFYSEVVANIRTAAENVSRQLGYNCPVAIAIDTRGPEIHTGLCQGNTSAQYELKRGSNVMVTTNTFYKDNCSSDVIWVDYFGITNVVRIGNSIVIGSDRILLKIKDIIDDNMPCSVKVGGTLGAREPVYLPNANVDLPAFPSRDRADFEFAIKYNLDIVIASFIRSAAAIKEIRKVFKDSSETIKIFAKIQNKQGLDNIQEIIAVSDGIMIERGVMSNELTPETIFLAQKSIICRCNRLGIPVMCSSDMLKTMTNSNRPTRAETTDVANAVLDGVDIVTLSSETAVGKYPLLCTEMMAKICKEAEGILWYKHLLHDMRTVFKCGKSDLSSFAFIAVEAAMRARANAIIILNDKIELAMAISKLRSSCPLILPTNNPKIPNLLHIHHGAVGLLMKENATETALQYAIKFCKDFGIIKDGDFIVVVPEGKVEGKSSQEFQVLKM